MTSDPWSELGTPENPGDLGSRRADLKSEHDFYWAKDFSGRICFLIKFTSEDVASPQIPNISGIELTFENSPCILLLALIDNSQRDIFRTICHDLLDACTAVKKGDAAAAAAVIVTRLERWQDMLRPGRNKLLSKSQRVGLFGELWFLHDTLLPKTAPYEAASAWKGPQGHEQDFAIFGHLIEIKTQSASRDRLIDIASMEQLNAESGRIWLLQQTVMTSDKSTPKSNSLQQLVNMVEKELEEDQQAKDLYNRSLLEVGFKDNPEYEREYMEIERRRIFEITENFPAVTRKIIPEAVASLSYRLEAASLAQWQVEEDCMLKEIFE